MTVVSKVFHASIISIIMVVLILEAVNTSETSFNFYDTTWRNIPEDSQLNTPTKRTLYLARTSLAQVSTYTAFNLAVPVTTVASL
jgi:hypothetical protein